MQFLDKNFLVLCDCLPPSENPGGQVARGHAYLFRLDDVRAAAARENLHLDPWLTRAVARHFLGHEPVHVALIFFSIGRACDGRDFIRLTICPESPNLQADWLTQVPGFFDYGYEQLPNNARVWALWDGGFSRVHDFEDGEPSGLMVVDSADSAAPQSPRTLTPKNTRTSPKTPLSDGTTPRSRRTWLTASSWGTG